VPGITFQVGAGSAVVGWSEVGGGFSEAVEPSVEVGALAPDRFQTDFNGGETAHGRLFVAGEDVDDTLGWSSLRRVVDFFRRLELIPHRLKFVL